MSKKTLKARRAELSSISYPMHVEMDFITSFWLEWLVKIQGPRTYFH